MYVFILAWNSYNRVSEPLQLNLHFYNVHLKLRNATSNRTELYVGFTMADALFQSVCLCGGLQKIRRGCSRWNDSFRVWHRSEELWLSRVDVLKDHDGGDVPAAVAVVGRRPHRHQLLVEHELVAFVHQLVCAADEFQVVDVDKLATRRKQHQDKNGG